MILISLFIFYKQYRMEKLKIKIELFEKISILYKKIHDLIFHPADDTYDVLYHTFQQYSFYFSKRDTKKLIGQINKIRDLRKNMLYCKNDKQYSYIHQIFEKYLRIN